MWEAVGRSSRHPYCHLERASELRERTYSTVALL